MYKVLFYIVDYSYDNIMKLNSIAKFNKRPIWQISGTVEVHYRAPAYMAL